ncbi:MAG: AAA family ATPase [bacterium]|nr:AAA family ATPase [bacterium]
MSSDDSGTSRPAWFLGAYWDGEEQPDQTDRFVREGIWENGYEDKYLDVVKSIQIGDRVAIKAWSNRKSNLPFESHGYNASIMRIKATGVVTDNLGDGRRLKVDWTLVTPSREWYFYTYGRTVWQIQPGNTYEDALLRFTFEDESQDIEFFRNEPYWRERFGDESDERDEHLDDGSEDDSVLQDRPPAEPDPATPYSVDDIIADGCFIDRGRLETMLERLRDKKNLILQGPPGTGKTWLAKRLAYALIGTKSQGRVRPFQFHPNLSYEDFVRGYRPSAGGRLDLVDGPFLETVEVAKGDPDNDYVVVIEEINRGNPAQIFGEMLTLLEADKRSPAEAIALSYPRDAAERVYIPPNLYVIGTMNVADRSLALVDFALRRRFAFVDLEPTFGEAWRTWMSEQCRIEEALLRDIDSRLNALNEAIATDAVLGPNFRVGHSVVTPRAGIEIQDPQQWFKQVVETEITPLLGEYWFDDPKRAEDEGEKLLRGLTP